MTTREDEDEAIEGHEKTIQFVEEVLRQIGAANLDTTRVIGLLIERIEG